ncbi:ESPR-type extended signal peptide-containing protein [Megasphaera sp. DJF_B143]|uniref:ESPR-type extended signal peptide-containing protein n=1 Tax=Megasphaera sp. DJF_B143 TaxID=537288 RepID=UPI00073E134B|nr:ESPR-type extended signal peptide-containing protein [Megasphaera sp. DJF_B143]KUH56385.1 hypothetical protein AT798_03370 [Megasphaera sp. DJF_B143]
MNKIFKVIWSKSRNCYVVASELAKGRTKAASTGDKAKRLALAAITALMLLPVGGFSYAAINSATINGTSVITGTQKDADDISGTVMKATNNARDIGDLKTAMQSVETELAQHQSVIDNLGTDKLTLSSDNTLQKETYDSATKTTTTTDVTGLKVAGPVSAKSASISGTLSAGGAVNAGSVNSRGNITAVGTIAGQTVTATGTIKGKDLIGTNSIISQGTIAATGNISSQATVGAKEIVSQTNITAKNKVVGMQGVVDNTLTSGNYVTAGNTVGENIVALDTQVKANADQFTTDKTSTALHVSKDGNLIVGTKENQTVKDLKIRGQLTSGSISTGDITSSGDVSVAGKVEAEAVYDDTTKTGNYVVQTNSVGANLSALDTQVKSNADAITAEATAREAGDTALNERITNVKEYLEKQTSDNYVSKADAAVQDGAIVKAANTIGENVTNLDAALAKETAARIGADAAQDKVIQQVNQNMVDGFNTINKNMADGFTALNQADAKEAQERAAADAALDDKITAETSARVAADTKLVEAVNSGLSLSNDNVLQKNTTTIDAQGNVTTSKTDANEMILNKGKDNQITLNENGIKVGTNSTVVDKDGVYTGGDTYSEAKAAMSADGKIKGANGAFTVDENGNVTSKATITGETVTDGKGASMSNGTVTGKTLTDGIATITNGNINTSGSITGGTVTSTGNISALGDIHAGGAITGASASIQGALTAGSATITGDLTAGGAIQGKSISDGTATMQNGNLTGVKNLSAETITTSGNATIGSDLTVNGKLNVDEIDLTKNGIVGDNNVTASTKVAAGEITSYKKATSTKDGSEKESAIDYDENGTSTWAKSTDADGNWNKSTLTVEGNDVTSKVIDSEKNSNLSTQTSTQSQSTLKDKDSNTNTATQSATESSSVLQDKEGKTSTFQQRVDEILNQINSSDTVFSKVDQKVDNISSEVTDGTNTTSSTQTTTDITNTAKQGTITNEAKDIINNATENMTNTVGKDLTTTVTGKVTEDYKSDLDTKVGGNETHYVAGNQTNTVSGDRTVSVKGTETENFNAQVTNVKTDQRTSVGGSQTNIVAGNQQNTVSGSKTETVKGSVTEKYGSQATTVDGDQSTNVGGNQFNVVAGDQTNTISGSKTESVKGAVTETYGSQSTTVNGNQSNTVKGTLTETVTGDVTEDYKANLSTTVGGNQTTTVTGDSSLTAENITNEAKNKITNKAIDVETDATSSIVQKVANDYGSNTSTQLSYQTTEEMSQADGKTAFYLRGAAEEKSQLIDGANKTTIDTIAGQTNTNITDGTNTSNDLQKADQIASSVTDGTNTTVVNQDAKSLASSITDGTKSNNTNNTVDKSEQLIKASDTQYNASVKTATTSTEKLVSGSIIDILKDADNGFVNTTVSTSDGTSSTSVSQGSADITNTAKQGTITNDAKNLVNKAEEKLSNSAAEIENTATTSIKDTVGKSTVTTTTDGTTFENTDHNTAIGDGSITKTTISGNTLETGKATMDYAEVMKDLTVGGTTTTKDLHVTNNATIDGTLDVAGAANFQDTVTVVKDLSVGGNASVSGSVTASSYKVGDKTYIDDNGINANNQKITNVAAGELSANSLDAVNGSQLYETNRRVSKMDSRINEVGANAAAMANLHPLEFDADSKFNVAAAVGNYKNETATALGLFYRPNEDVMVNLSGTVGSDDNMIGGGVAVRIGRGGNKARNKQMAESAKYVKNLESQVNTLQHQMDALLSVLNPNLSKEFPDVPENHWAYEAVSRLAGNGIIQGYEDGKYHGERTMTRYEMAEIIYKALQKGAKAEAKLVEEFKPELKAMAAQNKA